MNRFAKQARYIVGMLLAALLLTACSEDMSDLEAYIKSVKARPADPIPPIPPVKSYIPYEYEGLSARDPFRPSITEGPGNEKTASNKNGPRPDFKRPKEYLERYELDTLSMVGTFSKGDNYWALIRDPEGVVHRVAVGEHMGKNYGRVVEVTDTQIRLSELISDGAGGWLVREASIALGEG